MTVMGSVLPELLLGWLLFSAVGAVQRVRWDCLTTVYAVSLGLRLGSRLLRQRLIGLVGLLIWLG